MRDMTNGKKQSGTGETLRGVLVIVVAGAALGAGFNALGLASRPPRGLPWVKVVPRLPSLEEMQGERAGAAAVAPGKNASPGPAPAVSAPGPSVSTPAQPAPPQEAVPGGPGAAAPVLAPPVAILPAAEPLVTPASAAADLPVVPDRNEPIEVQSATAKKFFDAKAALFVDAREAPEFAEGHIAGALNLPFDDVVAKPALLGAVKSAGRVVIVYCGGGDCEVSKNLAWNLLDAGIRKVLVYTGGYKEWQAAGHPVERGPAKGGS